METAGRSLRGMRYLLSDLEAALKKAGRIDCAQGLDAAARRIHVMAPDAFLQECRHALEEVLLGERDLSSDLIGQTLDLLAVVDEILREQGK